MFLYKYVNMRWSHDYVSLLEGVIGDANFFCTVCNTVSARETTVNVPPMMAHNDVINSYHLRPA